MQQRPKLRDNKGKGPYELYPLGQIPDEVIYAIGKWMAYHFTVGKSDIDGRDWGDVFAKAINGSHMNRPIGLADVVYEGMAWSVKSVKHKYPLSVERIRVISGRCSPSYSYGISDPRQDVQKTGEAVLGIWNERINIAKEKYEPLRTSILVRNSNTLEFLIFENEAERFIANNYAWKENQNGNLEGYELLSNKHIFTWQPHGAQFTILYDIPASAKKFKVKRPSVLDFEKIMENIGFDSTWVAVL
jgi:hypothetical protein